MNKEKLTSGPPSFPASRLPSSGASRLRRGLTLIEIMISITLIAIIATVGIVAANPSGQLAKSRNNDRQLHLQSIMLYIKENIVDYSGVFTCSSGPLPTGTTRMASASGSYDIAPCLLPPVLPFDPSTSTAHWTSASDYDTGYNIVQDATTSAITVSAPAAELKQTISITR